MSILKVKDISLSIKNKKIIDKISFNIDRGEIVGLLGPNGAGKTTTFYSILGLIKIDSGQVFLDGKEITKLPSHERASIGISYLPQEPSIFRNLSVKSNILGVAELNFSGNQEVESFYEKTLKEFGLSDIENSKGYVLSGGQRRKVEFARCLASRPKLILLDEPFSGIDPLAIVDIKKMLRDLSEKGICILITDHNIKETIEVCDFSIIIADGKILDKGKQEYLVNSKLVKEKYFGKVFD